MNIEIMGKKILLPNRYGDKNYLELIHKDTESAKFKLILENDFCCRFIYPEGTDLGEIATATHFNLEAVDPSGGPFMGIGWKYQTETEKFEVIKIDWYKNDGIYLTFSRYDEQ